MRRWRTMNINGQQKFDLPPIDEPEPWLVKVWRHFSDTDYPFVTKEDAIAFAIAMEDEDCFVEGIFRGEEDATLEAFPWRKVKITM